MPQTSVLQELASGEAFVDLSGWRKVAATGADAPEWLNDIVSADLADLAPGHARRSLLLLPTGGIRAEFTVARLGEDLLLVQDPDQATGIARLLAPYVLSSDVELVDRSDTLALFAFPGRSEAPVIPGATASTPSCIGPGVDLLSPAEDLVGASLADRYVVAGPDALHAWRVMTGIPHFGVDALEGDLPQEAGFEDAVSFHKGCFLGQEAVAKVRNLGHPRRTILHLQADGPVSPGDRLEAEAGPAGEVTSAAEIDGHWWLLARIRWEHRESELRSAGGVRVRTASRRYPG